MKNKKLLLLFSFITLIIAGCSKTLQETPYSFLSTANFYKDQAEAFTVV